MPSRKILKSEKVILKKLADKVKKIILDEKGYRSLDAFYLENHDLIAKPTLYQICYGERDMKITTLIRLSKALEISIQELLKDI